jgi:hypothetical protein
VLATIADLITYAGCDLGRWLRHRLYYVRLTQPDGKVLLTALPKKAGHEQHMVCQFINDYAGPDRTEDNKRKCKEKLNCEFREVGDGKSGGWPALFVVTTRDIRKGEPLMLDYTDSFWDAEDAIQTALDAVAKLNLAMQQWETGPVGVGVGVGGHSPARASAATGAGLLQEDGGASTWAEGGHDKEQEKSLSQPQRPQKRKQQEPQPQPQPLLQPPLVRKSSRERYKKCRMCGGWSPNSIPSDHRYVPSAILIRYIHIHTYIYTYTYMHTCAYTYTYTYTYTHTYD